jgi:hypothetical protein
LLKKLSLVVGAALLLAACGASTSGESEDVGAVEAAVTGPVCNHYDQCGDDAYPASRGCSTACYPYACGISTVNVTNCVSNAGLTSYWQCMGVCDPGFHRTGLKCDTSACGPANCSNSTYFNMEQCEPNTDDFWRCGGTLATSACPAGYTEVESACDSTSLCGPCSMYSTGHNVRRCVKN